MAGSIFQTALTKLAEQNKIQPITQDYDESKGVAGRVNSLVSAGSPIMKTAQTQAQQATARRGLANSSMGVQAGQQAVINSALPIAQADASLFSQQALTNQNARNVAGVTNSQNAIAAGTRGAELDVNQYQFGKNLGENARQFDATQSLSREMFGSDEAFRRAQLAQQQSQFDSGQTLTREMFGSDDAFRKAQLAQQQSQFGVTSGQSQQQIDAQQAQFTQNLAQQQQQIDAQREQFAQTLGLNTQELGLRRDQLSQQQQQFLAELDQRQAQLTEQSRQFDTSRTDNLGMFDREMAQRAEQFGLSQAQAIKLAEMDVDSKIKLAGIEAEFKNQIQSSANISNAWGTVMQGIAQIQGNPELDEATKATLINNNLDSFKAFSAFWNKSTGIDVSDLLDFGMVAAPEPAPGGQPGTPGTPGQPGAPVTQRPPTYPGEFYEQP